MLNPIHTTLFIARHCRTQWNSEGRLQGTHNLPLSVEGKKEAESILQFLPSLSISRIISSDYLRAYETAKIYADYLKVSLHTHPGLRELDHGDWEGKIIADLIEDKQSGYKEWLKNPQSIPIPGGSETIYSAQQRITNAFKEISVLYSNENVLIVTHKHIRALLFLFLKRLDYTDFSSQVMDDIMPVEIVV